MPGDARIGLFVGVAVVVLIVAMALHDHDQQPRVSVAPANQAASQRQDPEMLPPPPGGANATVREAASVVTPGRDAFGHNP